MRYLFPAPAESASLLEKAQIWVQRHNHKYFVGWDEDQLAKVDTVLRPLQPITPDMYKLHMNRWEEPPANRSSGLFYLRKLTRDKLNAHWFLMGI